MHTVNTHIHAARTALTARMPLISDIHIHIHKPTHVRTLTHTLAHTFPTHPHPSLRAHCPALHCTALHCTALHCHSRLLLDLGDVRALQRRPKEAQRGEGRVVRPVVGLDEEREGGDALELDEFQESHLL
jgi:hypothetical protein